MAASPDAVNRDEAKPPAEGTSLAERQARIPAGASCPAASVPAMPPLPPPLICNGCDENARTMLGRPSGPKAATRPRLRVADGKTEAELDSAAAGPRFAHGILLLLLLLPVGPLCTKEPPGVYSTAGCEELPS